MDITNKSDFRHIFDQYYNPLCNFAFHIVHSRSVAEDIVQDVFTRMWEKRNDIESGQNLRGLLFTAAKNKALEYLRSSSRRTAMHQAANSLWQLREPVEEVAHKYLVMEKLNSSLRHLSPKCREVFVLHKMNGLTYSEIAQSLGISVKTVENHMIKALKILREKLK